MERNKLSSSFTLIELLISITIIFILSGLSLAYYNNFTQQQTLKNEAKKVIDVMELAKKKALTGDLSNKTCGNYNFNGYRIDLNSNNYQLKLCCNENCTNQQPINTFTFPNNINLINPWPQTYLRFFPMSNRVENAPLSLTIKNLSINKCIQIDINQFGMITLDETLTPC